MPLVPEGARPRQEVRASIAGQFWGMETASASSIDGKTDLLPCEPVALGPTAPTGLSRCQQLIAAQALAIPALPSYCHRDGGVVLDRVLAKAGGSSWWAAVGGRLRLQRAIQAASGLAGADRLEPLRDPLNYAGCLRLQWRLAKALTLQALLEARDIRPLLRGARKHAQRLHRELKCRSSDYYRRAGRQTVQQQTEMREDAVSKMLETEQQDDDIMAPCFPPASALYAARLALPGSHELQARLAIAREGRDAMGASTIVPSAASLDFCSGPDRGDGMQYRLGFHQTVAPATGDGEGPLRTSTHAQGAIAVEGETMLWRPARRSGSRRADPIGRLMDTREGDQAPTRLDGLSATSAVDEGPPADISSYISPLDSREPHTEGSGYKPSPIEQLNTKVLGTLHALQTVQEQVARVDAPVAAEALGRAFRRPATPKRTRPYSWLVPGPHLKLNGAIGCLARVPLPAEALFKSDNGWPALLPRPRRPRFPPLSRALLASATQHDAWEPYLRDTSLRVFLSAGLSGQLGRFTRRFLDYTAASVRVDLGLASPHVLGALPIAEWPHLGQAPLDRHPALALEGQGTWHALSAGIAQQIWGPLRARCDVRFALDPTWLPQDEGQRSTLRGLAATALSVRASRLETVLGLDCILPGLGGLARLGAWYSPPRGEAMLELHLM